MAQRVGVEALVKAELDEGQVQSEAESLGDKLDAEAQDVSVSGSVDDVAAPDAAGGAGAAGGADAVAAGGAGGGRGGLAKVALGGAVGFGLLAGLSSLAGDFAPRFNKTLDLIWSTLGMIAASILEPIAEVLEGPAEEFFQIGKTFMEDGFTEGMDELFEGVGSASLEAVGLEGLVNPAPIGALVTGASLLALLGGGTSLASLLIPSSVTSLLMPASAGSVIGSTSLASLIGPAGLAIGTLVIGNAVLESVTGAGIGDIINTIRTDDKKAATDQAATLGDKLAGVFEWLGADREALAGAFEAGGGKAGARVAERLRRTQPGGGQTFQGEEADKRIEEFRKTGGGNDELDEQTRAERLKNRAQNDQDIQALGGGGGGGSASTDRLESLLEDILRELEGLDLNVSIGKKSLSEGVTSGQKKYGGTTEIDE